ncbi:MAG: DUF5309 family protein [Capsulimonadaceae bacterium]|nr:DUF5309 family protein [Capsulimonadaceae bacterium]
MAGTNTNAVSFLGELFQSGKRPNNFLRLIGGLQGSVHETMSREFPTGVVYSLRAPSQDNVALEGANAPAAQTVGLNQAMNVVQLIQETVSLTYLGASDKTMSGIVPIPQADANGPVQNPRSEAFQVARRMETIAQDTNFSFLNGTYNNPVDATDDALKTRGILTAIATNLIDNSAVAANTVTDAIYRGWVGTLLQDIVTSTGYNPDETWTLFAGAIEYANIQAAYEAKGTIYLQPESNLAGIKIRRILTRYGLINIVLDPDMPNQELAIFNIGVVGVVGMPVPNKGILFAEPLAKTGSADNIQIYGQIGIDHGPEFHHGLVKVPAGMSL